MSWFWFLAGAGFVGWTLACLVLGYHARCCEEAREQAERVLRESGGRCQ